MKSGLAAIAAALALGGLGVSSAQAHARMVIVYDEERAAAEVLAGPGGITPQMGAFRQDPGRGGVFREGYEHHRLAKVGGHELAAMSTAEMVVTLRAAVDGGPGVLGGESHIAMVDEIGTLYRDPIEKPCYKGVKLGAVVRRIACQNTIRYSRNGYRVVKRPAPDPAVPSADHPSSRLNAAMRELAAAESPYGGSYASRVQFYIAPALVTQVGTNRGRHFSKNRAGTTNIKAAWRGVIRPLALSGGVWLEMYHGSGEAVSALTWRRAPERFGAYLARHGGSADRVNLLMRGTTTAPAGAGAGCTRLGVMGCTWQLAASRATRRYLEQGVGIYDANEHASAWRDNYLAHLGSGP